MVGVPGLAGYKISAVSPIRSRSWLSVLLGAALLLLAAGVGATAALAAQPKLGGLYEGTEPHCKAPTGFTCVFVFRVSANGRSMSFAAKENVVGVWACRGGGGEAVLGPYKKPLQGQPVPPVLIASTGQISGKQTWGSAEAKGTIVASGRFTGTGTTASLEFTMNPGSRSCTNGPISLNLH